MPGKYHNEDAWRFLTPYKFLREVTDPDTSVTGVQEFIDMSIMESAYRDQKPITMAYNNMLSLGVVLVGAHPAETTIDVYAYLDDKALAGSQVVPYNSEERWCLYQRRNITQSSILSVRDLPPVPAKVVVASLRGDGVIITYSRSE